MDRPSSRHPGWPGTLGVGWDTHRGVTSYEAAVTCYMWPAGSRLFGHLQARGVEPDTDVVRGLRGGLSDHRTDASVDPTQLAVRRMSRTEKEDNVSKTTEIETEPQREAEDERIVQLVSSGTTSEDHGEVVVWVNACEEPWVVKTGMRLTDADALELSHELREAARLVAGSEPQGFIWLRLFDDDAP
jgi:hypothetical protein